MFDPKKDISDIFKKGQKTIDKEIVDKGVEIKRPSLSEFKERVKKTIIENKKRIDINYLDKGYQEAVSLVPNIQYSLDDVVNIIHEYQNKSNIFHGMWSPGIYLSALINRVIKDNDVVTINIKYKGDDYTNYLLTNLGMYLPKGKLIINGDATGAIGYRMSGGEIIVNGNCRGEPAQGMKSGKILIKGDVLEYTYESTFGVAYGMEGGELKVLGNAKIHDRAGNDRMDPPQPWVCGGIGFNMKGGKVVIHDDTYDVGYEMEDGEIIVKGNVEYEHTSVGRKMKGGRLELGGFIASSVCSEMKGGNIIVNHVGYYPDMRNTHHGHIGHNMKGGKIVVLSSSYAQAGYEMRGGLIEIKRDLKHSGIGGGGMTGGTIIINGNAYTDSEHHEIAGGMEYGTIHVKGNINTKVGEAMKGGTVRIDGYMPPDSSYRIRDQPWREGGEVYHKGVKLKNNTNTKIANFLGKIFK